MLAVNLLAGIAGILSHVFYFNRGEHHLWAVFYVKVFSLGFAGSIVALINYNGWPAGRATGTVSAFFASYLLGTYTSLIIWRLVLSPVNRFPGPLSYKLSAITFAFTVPKNEVARKLQALHRKHGKYVRIGPNDLSISDPAAVEPTFLAGSKATKADWYDGSTPYDSMHSTRDKTMHDQRRRIWAPAFSDKAVRGYEDIVHTYNDKLVDRIREHKGGPINMAKWFNLYSFDVMGKLAFGKDYGMMDSGELHWALDLLDKGMNASPPKPPLWLFRVILAVPGLAAGFFKFLDWCSEELKWRIDNDNTSEHKDVTGWLLKAYKDHNGLEKDTVFTADVRLVVVAGSDTTAATLTHLFFELARRPEILKKLREELRQLTAGKEWSDLDVKTAPLLNAVINEALRMYPPVSSGVPRKTPKEGMVFDGIHVPGEVTYWIPQCVQGRDEDNYEDADSFRPERWDSKPEMVKHKEAFAPFSMGPYGCIGKSLAYVELRTVTTRILLDFDVTLAPGEDGKRLLNNTVDHFTLGLAPVDLVFSPIKA